MTIYVNAGALRKSIDGGENWNALGPYDILAIDPLKSGALYAVSGRLLKSTDGGASWSEADKGLPQLDDCYGLSSLFVHPKDTSTLYAGVSLDYCSGGEEGGVWRSMNGGVTWMKLPSQPPGNNVYRVYGLGIDPQDAGTIFAWNATGFFKSSDTGASWSMLGPVPRRHGDIRKIVIDPQSSNTVYVADFDGLFKSTDGGATWRAVNNGLPARISNFEEIHPVSTVVIDPRRSSTLYVGTDFGVFRSTDGGESWNPVNSGLTSLSFPVLAIDPLNTSRLYAGTPGGVFVITLE